MTNAVDTISVKQEDPRGDAATRLVRELTVEIASLYHDFGQDGSGAFDATDVLVPRSAYVVARLSDQPVGCGALRPIDAEMVEFKRMYVAPGARGPGVGRRIMAELERLAAEFDYRVMRLETGFRQPAAIALYERGGFHRIPPFGRYIGDPVSVCYEKILVKE